MSTKTETADVPELTEAEWLHDLRTTEARQARGTLYNPDDNSYCCLGRLCAVDKRVTHSTDDRFVIETDGVDYLINGFLGSVSIETGLTWPHFQTPWSWMSCSDAMLCSRANDTAKMSFAEIADWWEAGRSEEVIVAKRAERLRR